MSNQVQRKNYTRLLRSILLSPLLGGFQLLIYIVLATAGNWWGIATTAVPIVFGTAIWAYLWHDNLPLRYWIEGDELVVEDVSGEVLRYARWVQVASEGMPFIHGQTASRTVSLPVGGYVAVKGEAAHAARPS